MPGLGDTIAGLALLKDLATSIRDTLARIKGTGKQQTAKFLIALVSTIVQAHRAGDELILALKEERRLIEEGLPYDPNFHKAKLDIFAAHCRRILEMVDVKNKHFRVAAFYSDEIASMVGHGGLSALDTVIFTRQTEKPVTEVPDSRVRHLNEIIIEVQTIVIAITEVGGAIQQFVRSNFSVDDLLSS